MKNLASFVFYFHGYLSSRPNQDFPIAKIQPSQAPSWSICPSHDGAAECCRKPYKFHCFICLHNWYGIYCKIVFWHKKVLYQIFEFRILNIIRNHPTRCFHDYLNNVKHDKCFLPWWIHLIIIFLLNTFVTFSEDFFESFNSIFKHIGNTNINVVLTNPSQDIPTLQPISELLSMIQY